VPDGPSALPTRCSSSPKTHRRKDFRAAFGLGRDGRSIAEGNASGVALAAAKGLYRKIVADEAEIAAQREEIAGLKREFAAQRTAMARRATALAALAPRAGMGTPPSAGS
jgi:hypothetical protein